jgi:hypothetical protein
MHWLLRVISLGHVRTFTHHRLLLLEQKFNLHVMLNAGRLKEESWPGWGLDWWSDRLGGSMGDAAGIGWIPLFGEGITSK